MKEVSMRPDILLKKIEENEERRKKGKLKIFFGYAAGIGKTYAMLSHAHSAKKMGIDVVAGYIEPHARIETIDLIKGLETLEVKSIKQGNLNISEFDIDAALNRKPELILVDELAHTNAFGSRHEKRYQDIKELLNAGIDVYTTINVQHLESLNDIIAGITGVIVRERIPDSIFDEASQIEMVDIPPEELIERLNQGKIYKESQAKKALEHFFTIENLISLREIALRRMADWVNLEVENNIENKDTEIAIAEHILICLSSSPSNPKVIRQASRMAKSFHGKFTAFYVETSDFTDMTKEDLERLRNNTKLAEQLGAKVIISYGNDIVEQIAEYAKIAKVTKIVLGRTYTKRKLFSVKESFSDRLAKLYPQLEIFLIPDSYDKKYVARKGKKEKKNSNLGLSIDVFLIVFGLISATLISEIFQHYKFNDANLIMTYILGVLVISLVTQYQTSSIIYSLLSVFVFNYFFTEPVGTLTVNDPGYIITFTIMFITAVISSSLTQKVKKIAKQAAAKAHRTEILLDTSRILQQADSSKEIAKKTIEQLGKLLDRNTYCYIGNPKDNDKPISYIVKKNNEEALGRDELAVAEWTYKNNKHAGFSTTTLPGSRCLYLTIRNGEKVFAVVGIDMENKKTSAFEDSIMFAILNECALAFEKEEFIRREKEIAIKLEQEQLRANLLRSISHDLRTPLTSISGNAGVLIGNADKIDDEHKQKLYEDIYNDSVWLINLVENLMSVTRIENGTMKLNIQPELIDDVINESLKHINPKSKEHEICVDIEDDMLIANMDVKLIIQVLINLIDNAIKYTHKGSKITISSEVRNNKLWIEVSDNGKGIEDLEKEKIFTMFYRVNDNISDGARGTGLGLALCKSIINAHGSEIKVYDNIPCGSRFCFYLEIEEVNIK